MSADKEISQSKHQKAQEPLPETIYLLGNRLRNHEAATSIQDDASQRSRLELMVHLILDKNHFDDLIRMRQGVYPNEKTALECVRQYLLDELGGYECLKNAEGLESNIKDKFKEKAGYGPSNKTITEKYSDRRFDKIMGNSAKHHLPEIQKPVKEASKAPAIDSRQQSRSVNTMIRDVIEPEVQAAKPDDALDAILSEFETWLRHPVSHEKLTKQEVLAIRSKLPEKMGGLQTSIYSISSGKQLDKFNEIITGNTYYGLNSQERAACHDVQIRINDGQHEMQTSDGQHRLIISGLEVGDIFEASGIGRPRARRVLHILEREGAFRKEGS